MPMFLFFLRWGRREGKVCWSPSHVPTKLPLTGAKAYVKNGKGAELWKENRAPVSRERQGTLPPRWFQRRPPSRPVEATRMRPHVPVLDPPEASPLCLWYPGVCHGPNHYVHHTPFTWKLPFGLSAAKDTNRVLVAKKKPQSGGESAVMVGKCLHCFFSSSFFFFFFRNNAFWQFLSGIWNGGALAPWRLHLC